MATVIETKPVTAEEYFLMPQPADGVKHELIRGEVVEMPNPGLEHGEVQGNIYALLKQHLRGTRQGRVFVESGAVVDRNLDTVRGPDVSYYSKERLPLDLRVVAYHDQPPDLCVEVASPSNSKRKLREKVKEYFFAGVRLVWLVEPDDRSVTVLTAPDEGRTLYDETRLDGGDVLPGFACTVSDLFA